jgi:hypothetical protein
MRRGIAGLVAALLLLAILAPSVAASTGAVTPFKIAFDGGTCTGVHVVNKVSAEDLEVCLFTNTSGMSTGIFSGDPLGMAPSGSVHHWRSDYNGVVATRWTMIVVANGNGTDTMFVVSFY